MISQQLLGKIKMKLLALALLATAMTVAMNPSKASAQASCSCDSLSACTARCNGDRTCIFHCIVTTTCPASCSLGPS